MSMHGAKLLFEGYLKKRKDTMKMTWATYWFRLQNTTLFFYSKKDGSALHLRGLYYIYTVQSAREVNVYGEHFVFELNMTNGKRKVLAAETDALRKEWLRHLWRSMRLSRPGSTEQGDRHMDDRGHSTHSTLNYDSATGPEYNRPYCPTGSNYQRYKGVRTNSNDVSCGFMRAKDEPDDSEEGEYTTMHPIHQVLDDTEENPYEVPHSNVRVGNQQESQSGKRSLLGNMMSGLGGEPAGHATYASVSKEKDNMYI